MSTFSDNEVDILSALLNTLWPFLRPKVSPGITYSNRHTETYQIRCIAFVAVRHTLANGIVSLTIVFD
jgi:hypothetical protein